MIWKREQLEGYEAKVMCNAGCKMWRRWREFKFHTLFPIVHIWRGLYLKVESTQLSQSPLCIVQSKRRVAFFIERILSDPERGAISAAVHLDEHTMRL